MSSATSGRFQLTDRVAPIAATIAAAQSSPGNAREVAALTSPPTTGAFSPTSISPAWAQRIGGPTLP